MRYLILIVLSVVLVGVWKWGVEHGYGLGVAKGEIACWEEVRSGGD